MTNLPCRLVGIAAAAALVAASSASAFQIPITTTTTTATAVRWPTTLQARGRDDDDDEYDDDEYSDEYYEAPRRRRRRRPNLNPIDDLSNPNPSSNNSNMGIPSAFGRADTGLRLPASVSQALLAGVFVLGIGTGVTVDSQINTNPRDLASRDAVDKNAPNPTLCTTYGASAMAFDQRVFVSFNPFNVYVAQADVKPACVLRQSNVVPVLQSRNLLDDGDIRSCKKNMNTWAFVGDLNDRPQLSCVYKSEDAQNEFLEDPKKGIGEDYLDDDLANEAKKLSARGVNVGLNKDTNKKVKDGLTDGQRKNQQMGQGVGATIERGWGAGAFQ